MEKKVIAQVKRTKLDKMFKQLKSGAFPKSRLKYVRCELTIINGQIILSVPWAQFSLEAKTVGTAKTTFPLLDVSNVVKIYREKEISIRVTDEQVLFNSFEIKAPTCFFEDDKILRSVVLPVNSSEADLVRLLDGRYTYQELEFNKLWAVAVSAEKRLNTALNSVYRQLRPYGFTYEDVEKTVKAKIYL